MVALAFAPLNTKILTCLLNTFQNPLIFFVLGLVSATEDTLVNLFDTLGPKATPLYLCNTWTSGIKWRIPETIDCPLINTEKPSSVVNVTFWFEDISIVKIQAWECFSVETRDEKNWFFLGGSTHTVTKHKSGVNPAECKHMVEAKEDPEGVAMVRLRDGQFGTEKVPDNEFTWPGKTISYVTNYYYVSLSLVVSNEDESVQSTTKITEICYYSKGTCQTELGIILWDPTYPPVCRLKRGVSTSCLLTDNRLSCPEENLSITKIQHKKVCNQTLGYSTQGILFTEDTRTTPAGPKDLGTVPTKILDNYILLTKSRAHRVKRGVVTMRPVYYKIPEDTIYTSSQVNGKLQYLFDIVNKSISFNVQQIHQEICYQNRRSLQMLRILAMGGQTSLLTRVLLGEDSYRSSLNGDVLSVYKCDKIYNYMMLTRNECTTDWPILYLDSHDKKQGYLTPLSHEIVESPNIVTCPPPDFYFDTGIEVYLLTNRTIPSHLPTLPKPSENLKASHLPDISFSGVGVYKASALSNKESILELVRDMRNNIQFDGIIQSTIEGRQLTPEQTLFLSTVIKTLSTPFRLFFDNIVGTFISGALMVILAILAYRHRVFIWESIKGFIEKVQRYFERKKAMRDFVNKNRKADRKVEAAATQSLLNITQAASAPPQSPSTKPKPPPVPPRSPRMDQFLVSSEKTPLKPARSGILSLEEPKTPAKSPKLHRAPPIPSASTQKEDKNILYTQCERVVVTEDPLSPKLPKSQWHPLHSLEYTTPPPPLETDSSEEEDDVCINPEGRLYPSVMLTHKKYSTCPRQRSTRRSQVSFKTRRNI